MEKECKTCKYDGNQSTYPSAGCTDCCAIKEYGHWEPKDDMGLNPVDSMVRRDYKYCNNFAGAIRDSVYWDKPCSKCGKPMRWDGHNYF